MIPKPIYELLPYLYILIGLFSVSGFDVTGGRLSGALLMVAGVLIFKMRRDYRTMQGYLRKN